MDNGPPYSEMIESAKQHHLEGVAFRVLLVLLEINGRAEPASRIGYDSLVKQAWLIADVWISEWKRRTPEYENIEPPRREEFQS